MQQVHSKAFIFSVLFVAVLFALVGFFALASTRDEPLTLAHEKNTHFSERIADNSVAVYYGCGTECEGIRVFDEKTGKQTAEFNYGVGYLWSPDKKNVAAFHSSAGRGFTVGNGKGEELFIYTKPLENNFDIPDFAQWSPDSSKLAVIIQDSETEDELFVVWGFEGVMRTTSVRIPFARTHAIDWDKTGHTIYVNGVARLTIDDSGYGHRLLNDEGNGR